MDVILSKPASPPDRTDTGAPARAAARSHGQRDQSAPDPQLSGGSAEKLREMRKPTFPAGQWRAERYLQVQEVRQAGQVVRIDARTVVRPGDPGLEER